MKTLTKDRKLIYAVFAAIAFTFVVMANGLNVHAAEGFDLYTVTPGINITAGDAASFDLYLTGGSAAGQDVTLSIESMPEGFTGYFKNGSYDVSRVHASGDADTSIATLQVTVPTDAADGVNEIVIKALSDSGMEDTLTLNLNISELKSGDSNFTVQYPDQEGVTGTSFSYSTTIINNSLTDENYNFSTNAPEGWQVTFTNNDTQVSSLDVPAGASAGVTIKVTPPDQVPAGDYKISCSATSAKESLSTDLNVKILGTYNLVVTTSDGNLALDAYANKASDVKLLIKNDGNIDLENISLTAQANTNWDVSFDKTTIESLAAGTSEEVVAHITPSNDSITGDYLTNIVASCDNQSSTAQLRVTVKTKTGWGIFAIVIILGVCCGLYQVIKKYGRR